MDKCDLHYAPDCGMAERAGTALIKYVKGGQEEGTTIIVMFQNVGFGDLHNTDEAYSEMRSIYLTIKERSGAIRSSV